MAPAVSSLCCFGPMGWSNALVLAHRARYAIRRQSVRSLSSGLPRWALRWLRAGHDVIAGEGPERIEGVWGSDESGGPTRDCFRVEDRKGLRFWLLRAGLYHEMTLPPPRWFLHGTYA